MFLFWVTSIYFEAFMSGAQRVFPLYLSYHKESSPQKSPPPEGTDGGLVSGFSFRALLRDHLLCCGDGCGLRAPSFAWKNTHNHLPGNSKSPHNKDDVTKGADPAKRLPDALLHELFASGIPHALGRAGVKLDEATGQQTGDNHQHQTSIESPETGHNEFFKNLQPRTDSLYVHQYRSQAHE